MGQILRAWVATFVILLVAYVAQQVIVNVYDLEGSGRWLAGAASLAIAVGAMGYVARRQART